MTTFVPFVPSAQSPFTFMATLDGNAYNVIVTWNYYGQRYYVNIYTIQGDLVVSIAMIGSPDEYDISMTAGYFESELIFRVSSNTFEIT